MSPIYDVIRNSSITLKITKEFGGLEEVAQIYRKVPQFSQRERPLPPYFLICVKCFFHGNENGNPVLTPSEINTSSPGFFLEIRGFSQLATINQLNIWEQIPRPMREACIGTFE